MLKEVYNDLFTFVTQATMLKEVYNDLFTFVTQATMLKEVYNDLFTFVTQATMLKEVYNDLFTFVTQATMFKEICDDLLIFYYLGNNAQEDQEQDQTSQHRAQHIFPERSNAVLGIHQCGWRKVAPHNVRILKQVFIVLKLILNTMVSSQLAV